MKFFYYPGCSLEGTANEYDTSTRAVMRTLGVELLEIEDWTCCGASAGDAVSPLLSLVLPARNLALVERTKIAADILAPCSACYLNLRKVDDHMKRDEKTTQNINEALGEEGLRYTGGIRVRHLLDVLSDSIGPGRVAAHVKHNLSGLKVAPYYGCQALRPYRDFDDPERPKTMEPLIKALGADVHPWSMGAKCCGAGLMTTKKEIALGLTGEILKAARGADCIVTVCPMCQMNLEAYQKKLSSLYNLNLEISVLYLPQLMGFAFGIPEKDLKMGANFAVSAPFQRKLQRVSAITGTA